MSRTATIFILCLGFVFFPGHAFSQTLRVLLPELLNTHERIMAAEDRRDEAIHLRRQALGGWYPKVDLSADGGREWTRQPNNITTTDYKNTQRLRATQLVWDFGYTQSGVERADQVLERAKVDLESTRQAVMLNDLVHCDLGVSPTRWQKAQFPRLFHDKIAEIHDGVDTDYFAPERRRGLVLPNLDLTGVGNIVTYVSRGMEPYRGFPQFIEALPEILKADPACHVVIVASERVCYGKPLPNGKTYKDVMLEKVPLDLTRVHFVGTLPYGEYKKVLQASAVHVYLTRPFVLSWSLLEALSCGGLVVASDTPPVREVIRDGVNGIMADFNSPSDIASKVIGALTYPSFTHPVREKARKTIEERYALKALLPRHLALIYRAASKESREGPFG